MKLDEISRKRLFVPVMLLLLVGSWTITGYAVMQIQPTYERQLNENPTFNDLVHIVVYKAGAIFDPTSQQCIANCIIKAELWIPNLLTNGGKNLVKTDLGVGGSVTAALYIAPANATFTAAVASTQCCGGSDKSFPASGGLNPQVGAYTSTGDGTWTVIKTFTLVTAASATVYGAGLLTAATSGEIAEALFTTSSVTLATNDSLQITWSMTVS